MKAFIGNLEIPFKDLGEPQVTFEGETYEVITDQTGEPYFMINGKAQYIELRDDDGNDITPGREDYEEEDAEPEITEDEVLADTEEVIAEVANKSAPAKDVKKDPFMLAIEAMLNARAEQDELFAVTLAKPNKSLKECCDYIYAEVKKSGREGFADDEVLAMAVHYYDEDDVKPGKNVQKPGKVIVNTPLAAPKPVELTEEEKEKARKLAVDRAIQNEANRLLATKKKAAAKPVAPVQSQQSLF